MCLPSHRLIPHRLYLPCPPPCLQIGLVTELLGVAGRALAAHPGLVPLSLGLQLGGWLLLNLPLLAGMLAGLANGSLAYNTQRSAQGGDGGGAAGGEECRGEGGEQVLCCVWQVGGEPKGTEGGRALGRLGTELVLCSVRQVGRSQKARKGGGGVGWVKDGTGPLQRAAGGGSSLAERQGNSQL